MTMNEQTVFLSFQDASTLSRWIDRQGPWMSHPDRPAVAALARVVARACVVSSCDLPEGTVALDSSVRIRRIASCEEAQIRLTSPDHALPELGHVSVLAPLGLSLLGRRAGQQVQCPLPEGDTPYLILDVWGNPPLSGDEPASAAVRGAVFASVPSGAKGVTR